MIPVLLESRYAGTTQQERERNIGYARRCMRDCLERGEAPFASHLLYTQEGVLDDDVPWQRERGIEAGFAWGQYALKTVVYVDLGISKGMQQGIENAQRLGRPIEYRRILGAEAESWMDDHF